MEKLQILVDTGVVTDTIDFAQFVDLGLASKNSVVKVLGRGEIKAKLKVSAHKFSASAKEAIEAAGGEVVIL